MILAVARSKMFLYILNTSNWTISFSEEYNDDDEEEERVHDDGYEGSADGSNLGDDEEHTIDQDDEGPGLSMYATNDPFIEELYWQPSEELDIPGGISQQLAFDGPGEVILKLLFLLLFLLMSVINLEIDIDENSPDEDDRVARAYLQNSTDASNTHNNPEVC